MLERQEGEVDHLDERPHHPVGLQRRPPRLVEALLDAGALHRGHAAQERADHDGREEHLVAGDASEHLDALVPRVDVASQEAEPRRGHGAEDAWASQSMLLHRGGEDKGGLTAAVEGHAAGTGQVMLLDASLLNELLGSDVAGREEHGRRHALSEQRTGGKSAIVPAVKSEVCEVANDIEEAHQRKKDIIAAGRV